MNILLENIKILAENENLTITKLEQEIGASKAVLSRAITKNTDIQAKWILKIAEKYPQYSCDWLIKSEVPMLREIIEDPKNFLSSLEGVESFEVLSVSQKQTIESLQKIIFYLEKQIEVCKKGKNND